MRWAKCRSRRAALGAHSSRCRGRGSCTIKFARCDLLGASLPSDASRRPGSCKSDLVRRVRRIDPTSPVRRLPNVVVARDCSTGCLFDGNVISKKGLGRAWPRRLVAVVPRTTVPSRIPMIAVIHATTKIRLHLQFRHTPPDFVHKPPESFRTAAGLVICYGSCPHATGIPILRFIPIPRFIPILPTFCPIGRTRSHN